MKTNRKTRPQPSLASLTTDEYHQLADMVCARTYEDVRQQVNKPRSEGGFDLNISVKPLQVLHTRVQRLNKINEKLAFGEKLTLTAYDEIHAGEYCTPEEVHDAIMSATYLLVTEHDNSPHQLLALQRLADYPARAEIRENRERIYQERHTHKIEMDTFHKQHATERLEIQKRHLQLAEKRSEKELSTQKPTLARGGDHLGPFAKNWEDVRERARKAFGITPEESARRAELRRTWKDPYQQDQVTVAPESSGAQLSDPKLRQ